METQMEKMWTYIEEVESEMVLPRATLENNTAIIQAVEAMVGSMTLTELFKYRLRDAGEVLQDDEYDFLRQSGQLYMSDEDSDIEDRSVVWAVLDQNRKNRRLPFSNKERKRKPTKFTDRRPPQGGRRKNTHDTLLGPNQLQKTGT
ncbi:hypothetical protein Bbelb_051690 [Branchiostoma belcheri]|nr:hypothetical protein Bbelb_051690 [Branchiostoma belcheri]